jgi:hypothetical protein
VQGVARQGGDMLVFGSSDATQDQPSWELTG